MEKKDYFNRFRNLANEAKEDIISIIKERSDKDFFILDDEKLPNWAYGLIDGGNDDLVEIPITTIRLTKGNELEIMLEEEDNWRKISDLCYSDVAVLSIYDTIIDKINLK